MSAERSDAAARPAAEPVPSAPSSLARAGLVVAISMGVGNGINLLFQWLMSRLLGRTEFGALGALLGISFILSVVGVALQSVVARHTALRRDDPDSIARLWASVLRTVVLASLVLGGGIAAASPALVKFLHLGSVGPVLWLAVSVTFLPTLPAVLGMLQGRERFAHLAGTLLAGAVARLGLSAALVALGFGVSGALAGSAAGSLLGALLGVWWTRHDLRVERFRAGFPPELKPELAAVWLALLGLFLVVNLDVILARHFMDARIAGLYAVGSLVAKVTYWAPRFVVVVVFPRLVWSADRGRLLARAALVEIAVSGTLAGAIGLSSAHLLGWVFGPAYVGLRSAVWLFAAIGMAFTIVHLLLFSGIAAGDRRITRALFAVGALKAALIFFVFHRSIAQIASVVLVAAALLVGFGVILEATRRVPRARGIGNVPALDVDAG